MKLAFYSVHWVYIFYLKVYILFTGGIQYFHMLFIAYPH